LIEKSGYQFFKFRPLSEAGIGPQSIPFLINQVDNLFKNTESHDDFSRLYYILYHPLGSTV